MLYEIKKKNISVTAPNRLSERKSARNSKPTPSQTQQGHANILRRKSIFIKDVSFFYYLLFSRALAFH